MSTLTENLQLNKPDSTDFYDIAMQNENMEKIDAFCGRKDNPHSVTKEQVGLGNVPNVSTNDQTPTYTTATSNTALVSGEKLSVTFGKIAKAVSSLISHLSDTVSHITSAERTAWNAKLDSSSIASKATADASGNNIVNTYATKTTVTAHTGNTSNPHKVTAEQVGAVPTIETSGYNFTNRGLNTINIDDTYSYNYVVAISEDGHGTLPISGWLNVMNFYTGHFATQITCTCANGTDDRTVRLWVRERYIGTAAGWSEWKQIHNASTIAAGTADMTAGTSALDTGNIYLVYE